MSTAKTTAERGSADSATLERMNRPLRDVDPEIAEILELEARRQATGLELIPSENLVSEAVLEAMGSVLTNKYAEGYPGKRYYGGCEFVDRAEQLAIDRAKQLFGAEHANVQAHSGTQANIAVYMTALQPGDTVLGMNLAHGGHLTHGHPLNFSGKTYKFIAYGVRKDTETIDYDEIERLAAEHKPKMIVAGASAYSRIIDFERMARIAASAGAVLFVDMAHIAGLVAAGVHPSPVPHADFVSTTTHKTLRGPRGGLVLCRQKWAKELDRITFPGTQGGPLMHTIAAKAVCLKEAMQPEFREYQKQVVANAKALADGHGAARLPHRHRRHGQPPVSGGPLLARPDRQGRAGFARSRRHHREQELHSLRSHAAHDRRRHSPGQPGGDHARHARAGDGAHRRLDRRSAGAPGRRGHRAARSRRSGRAHVALSSVHAALAAPAERCQTRVLPRTPSARAGQSCAWPLIFAAPATTAWAPTSATSSTSSRGWTTTRITC